MLGDRLVAARQVADECVDLVGEIVDQLELAVDVAVRRRHHDLPAAPLGRGEHRGRELREVRIRQIGHQEADRCDLLPDQAAREPARPVVQLAGCRQDPISGLRTDFALAVHGARDGLPGHTRAVRHVVDRGPPPLRRHRPHPNR